MDTRFQINPNSISLMALLVESQVGIIDFVLSFLIGVVLISYPISFIWHWCLVIDRLGNWDMCVYLLRSISVRCLDCGDLMIREWEGKILKQPCEWSDQNSFLNSEPKKVFFFLHWWTLAFATSKADFQGRIPTTIYQHKIVFLLILGTDGYLPGLKGKKRL